MSNNPLDNGYVLVAERHAQFVKDHPDNAVHSYSDMHVLPVEAEILGWHSEDAKDKGRRFEPFAVTGFVTARVELWKNRGDMQNGYGPDATGMASMPIPGPTSFTRNSELENAETSALGRALAMLGYHPKDTLASNDEIEMKGGTTKPTRKRKVTPKSDKVNIGRLAEVLARGKALHGGDSKALGEFVKDATGVSKKEELTNAQLDMLEDLFKVKEAEDAGE